MVPAQPRNVPSSRPHKGHLRPGGSVRAHIRPYSSCRDAFLDGSGARDPGRKRPSRRATELVRDIDRIAGRPTKSDRIPTRDVLSVPVKRPGTGDAQRFRWSALVWSPPPESNRRPHPYHGTTRNRCANRRSSRSRPTVGVEVIGSPSTELCVLFSCHAPNIPRAAIFWREP